MVGHKISIQSRFARMGYDSEIKGLVTSQEEFIVSRTVTGNLLFNTSELEQDFGEQKVTTLNNTIHCHLLLSTIPGHFSGARKLQTSEIDPQL